jgi:hypothetical protein
MVRLACCWLLVLHIQHSLKDVPGNAGRLFRSVSRHVQDSDAGDLALGVEAEEKAGRIAAREYQLHLVESLVVYRALLHDFGAQRRRPVLVEMVRHRLHRVIGQLGAIGGGVLRAVDLTRLHLRKPLKRKGPHVVLGRHAGRRRRVGVRGGNTACQKHGDQHGPTEAPHLRSSAFELLIQNLHRAPPFG